MNQLRELIHGGDIATHFYAHPGRDILDFSANINPLGMPPSVLHALTVSAKFSVHYPDQHCRHLRQALSWFEEVSDQWILCGNGAADLIYRIVGAVRPRRALMLAPTFAEYEQALLQYGAELRFHQLDPEQKFEVGSDLLAAIPGCDLVFLCNPNNPTGKLMEPMLLEAVLEGCKANSAILVVDECFIDFIKNGEQYSLKKSLASHSSLIVLRAFTKIFAIPGLRLGYLMCSDGELVGRIDRAGAPWSVSVPAQLCGVAAVGEQHFIRRTQQLVQKERAFLAQELRSFGFRVYDGAANYLLFHTQDVNLANKLCEKGVILRDCSNYRGLAPGYFRTAVRDRDANSALIAAIKELV